MSEAKFTKGEWLHKMPDASNFKDGWWFACDYDGEWFAYDEEPEKLSDSWHSKGGHCSAMFVDLPVLTGEQWKYSCISVLELAEWQGENRD